MNEIFAEYYQVSTGLLKTEDAKILKLTREFIIRTMLMQCDLFTKEAEREEVKSSLYGREEKTRRIINYFCIKYYFVI